MNKIKLTGLYLWRIFSLATFLWLSYTFIISASGPFFNPKFALVLMLLGGLLCGWMAGKIGDDQLWAFIFGAIWGAISIVYYASRWYVFSHPKTTKRYNETNEA